MSCSTRLALAVVASLTTSALVPDTAAAFALGHGRVADLDRSVAAFTPHVRSNNAGVSLARFRCHSVQVGDPRKQPPMLVC